MKKFTLGFISALTVTSGLVLADQVVQDDQIVIGSSCVGVDCVNGEAFGFDTIRLKENNLRIKFQDTSSSGSFPTVDWQLTANDSANGGLNKFSIDAIDNATSPFTVEYGAKTNSVYIDSTSRVGFGTATPTVGLHHVNGNTPTLRLEQDGSSGFTAQTWDVAGNESGFFVRDATNGSKLPFRILPGAPSSSIHIDSDGSVAIGTSTFPTHATIETALMVEGDAGVHNGIVLNSPTANTVSSFTFTKAGVPQWFFSSRNDLDSDKMNIYGNAVTPILSIAQDGKVAFGLSGVDAANSIQHSNGARLTAGGVWTDASSRTLKDNIVNVTLSAAIEALEALNPVTFSYKAQPEETYAGFIAEDVPDMVATNDRKGLAPMDIVAILTKVVQNQNQTITELNNRLSRLEELNK